MYNKNKIKQHFELYHNQADGYQKTEQVKKHLFRFLYGKIIRFKPVKVPDRKVYFPSDADTVQRNQQSFFLPGPSRKHIVAAVHLSHHRRHLGNIGKDNRCDFAHIRRCIAHSIGNIGIRFDHIRECKPPFKRQRLCPGKRYTLASKQLLKFLTPLVPYLFELFPVFFLFLFRQLALARVVSVLPELIRLAAGAMPLVLASNPAICCTVPFKSKSKA